MKSHLEILRRKSQLERELNQFYHDHPEIDHEPEIEAQLDILEWVLKDID